jgi:hypothetical protein|tara:strand:- start:47 stop:886 length:840 start_codon:yes stop_codon:yes gene_type:complete
MKTLRILSLGAGVQSSTLALMIEKGEVPMVDGAIFSDTMGEPTAVYEWLNWLKKQLSFPVYVVSKGSLIEDLKSSNNDVYKRGVSIPMFTKNKITGKKGIIRRACTTTYKIEVITKKIRELLGVGYRKKVSKDTRVEMLMGISYDEIIRMKTNHLKYVTNTYPLVDKRMRRSHCLEWMKKNNYPTPPRSACTFCPYHSNTEWKRIKENKKEWDNVVKLDGILRSGLYGLERKEVEYFLHKDCVPLDQADLRTNVEKGQPELPWEDFGQLDNCDTGICGV